MTRRTIGVTIETVYNEYDELARRVIEEAGATYQGTSVGSGVRNYYLEATDEQMTTITDALKEAGAKIVLEE